MHKTSTTETDIFNLESWELPETGQKLYTADAVIEAYVKGKNEGKLEALEQKDKVLQKHFANNLKKSGEATIRVYDFMKQKGIQPLSAHLKPESFNNFSVLITVREEDFVKDSFNEVYQHTLTLEDVIKNELAISFGFINKTDHFDAELVNSDGFIFNFVDKPKDQQQV